jgi:NAD(P)-dependent dehydrogenase (short-subunit alcohol dehydrogenase family)
MVFSQEAIKRMLADHGEKTLAEGAEKKGTLIFTGTLGALRCNAEFGSYGASRGSVRQLAQALAKEMSPKGIHVAVSSPILDSFRSDRSAQRHR